jgi:hypothetical protein
LAAEARPSPEQTRAVSATLIGRAQACAATAAALRYDAARLRIRAAATRRRPAGRSGPSYGIASFTLEGVVEHREVRAEWRDGRLLADPLLLERAHLVVGLGEQFAVPDTDPLTASLTGLPIVALLTLMRACDRVRQVDVSAPAATAPAVNQPGPAGGTGSG